MFKPLSLFIGLRYTRAKRRNQYISFVSLVSLLGMVLGVFALVVVLSVMNGFEAELRGRILSVVPHGYLIGPDGRLPDWPRWATEFEQLSGVKAVAPYISGNAMLSRPGMARGVELVAVEPGLEAGVSQVSQRMIAGSFDDLSAGSYGMVIGNILARSMGLSPGDSITVLLPKVTVTPVGVFPRAKRFTVVGIFSVGAQLDGKTVFIHLQDGQKLFQLNQSVTGLRIELDDLFAAARILPGLASRMPEGSSAKLWSETQGSLFRAVKMEKTMISLLLLIIVAIAAFNIVSILTMMVADKRSDIAVLRTMGASPGTIMSVFMVQGITVGLVGISVGILLGIPVAMNVGDIVAWMESLFGGQVFNPQVYFISRIPSLLKWQDVLMIAGCGMLLSILATIYPARRAAHIEPAEVLRYE